MGALVQADDRAASSAATAGRRNVFSIAFHVRDLYATKPGATAGSEGREAQIWLAGDNRTRQWSRRVKPKLLVVELWGMGDLVIATPFLQAASQRFSVTLLAKPYARDLQARFWPEVKVIQFTAPWT